MCVLFILSFFLEFFQIFSWILNNFHLINISVKLSTDISLMFSIYLWNPSINIFVFIDILNHAYSIRNISFIFFFFFLFFLLYDIIASFARSWTSYGLLMWSPHLMGGQVFTYMFFSQFIKKSTCKPKIGGYTCLRSSIARKWSEGGQNMRIYIYIREQKWIKLTHSKVVASSIFSL